MKRAFTLHPREWRLALIAGVVIGCWSLVSWLIQPLWDRVRDLKTHVETQTEKLEKLGRLLEQAPTIDRQYQELVPYLETSETEQAREVFLNELEALSRSASLQLNLKPRPLKRESHLSRFEVELDVEGSQEQLMGFLDTLFTMPKLISIERLRISSMPAKENLLRANLVIQRVTLQ